MGELRRGSTPVVHITYLGGVLTLPDWPKYNNRTEVCQSTNGIQIKIGARVEYQSSGSVRRQCYMFSTARLARVLERKFPFTNSLVGHNYSAREKNFRDPPGKPVALLFSLVLTALHG